MARSTYSMQYQRRRMDKFLKGPEVRKALDQAARPYLRRAKQNVPVDTKETRRSGRLVFGLDDIKRDRAQVSIEFAGAAVPMEFGRHGNRFLSRTLREVSR